MIVLAIGFIIYVIMIPMLMTRSGSQPQLPSMIEFDGTPVNKRVVAKPVVDPFLQEAEMEVELMLKRGE